MKRVSAYAFLLLVGIVLVFFVSGCGRTEVTPTTSTAKGELLVAASIAPLGDFAREVGGERVQVEVLVPREPARTPTNSPPPN